MESRVLEPMPSLHQMLKHDLLQPAENMPNYWQLLSPANLQEYLELRSQFYDQIHKSRKGERLEGFIERLKMIRRFVERGDNNDWKRSFVCGIIFMSNSLAINIQQLRVMLGKCKSSINGSLQQLGYVTLPMGGPIDAEVLSKIPFFKTEHSELKKWTIRKNKGGAEALHPPPPSRAVLPVPELKVKKPLPPIRVPLPNIITPPPVKQEEKVQLLNDDLVVYHYPRIMCPIKIRAKVYNSLFTSVAIQTDM